VKTKIILELGCNHNGSMDNARRMLDDAAELEVWGVKFQKRDIASIPDAMGAAPRNLETSFGETYLEHRKALELHVNQLAELTTYGKKLGLAVGVSVFDLVSLAQMQKLPMDFIKLPSQLYANRLINHKLMRFEGKITMASTGMHTVTELVNVDHFGNHDVTFYCRSIYPAKVHEVRFGEMRRLFRELVPHASAPGYSSHEAEGAGIWMAVLLGAEYVERHYTLDKTMKGHDHRTVSSDRDEMGVILQTVEEAEDYLGGEDMAPAELKIRKEYRGF